mmetsp:Transcript_20506/g.23681  ORF Transcript_20506/g.23681 Transcript_20506/m.23681 type:complete len:117 (+) Transcript_20506:399-749(+)
MDYDNPRMYYKGEPQGYNASMYDMRNQMEYQRMRPDDKLSWMNPMMGQPPSHPQAEVMKDGMGWMYGKQMSGMVMSDAMGYDMRGGLPGNVILPGINQIEGISKDYKFDFNCNQNE